VFWAGLQASEVHQAPISVTGRRLLLISAPPKKNVGLRRSCGALPPAALRGGCVIPQAPAVPWARLSPHPPPTPCSFMPIASPVHLLAEKKVTQSCLFGLKHWQKNVGSFLSDRRNGYCGGLLGLPRALRSLQPEKNRPVRCCCGHRPTSTRPPPLHAPDLRDTPLFRLRR
jgi:hypothetical protein